MAIGAHYQKVDAIRFDVSFKDLSNRAPVDFRHFETGFNAMLGQVAYQGVAGFQHRRSAFVDRCQDMDNLGALKKRKRIAHCPRSLIFGGSATVEQYKGNPRVQAHGPGFSKIILGDDEVDRWEKYLDIMADSVFVNSGRGCINCSGIWVSRHGRKIAEALAERMGPVEPLPPEDPKSALAAFTVPGQADGVWTAIETDLKEPGVHHTTASAVRTSTFSGRTSIGMCDPKP